MQIFTNNKIPKQQIPVIVLVEQDRLLTSWCRLIWPSIYFMWVRCFVLVVLNHFKAFGTKSAAEVPLPDRRVSLSAAIATHFCPGLQSKWIKRSIKSGQYFLSQWTYGIYNKIQSITCAPLPIIVYFDSNWATIHFRPKIFPLLLLRLIRVMKLITWMR